MFGKNFSEFTGPASGSTVGTFTVPDKVYILYITLWGCGGTVTSVGGSAGGGGVVYNFRVETIPGQTFLYSLGGPGIPTYVQVPLNSPTIPLSFYLIVGSGGGSAFASGGGGGGSGISYSLSNATGFNGLPGLNASPGGLGGGGIALGGNGAPGTPTPAGNGQINGVFIGGGGGGASSSVAGGNSFLGFGGPGTAGPGGGGSYGNGGSALPPSSGGGGSPANLDGGFAGVIFNW